MKSIWKFVSSSCKCQFKIESGDDFKHQFASNSFLVNSRRKKPKKLIATLIWENNGTRGVDKF